MGELAELALLLDNEEVGDDFMGFFLSHEHSYLLGSFIFKELHFADSAFLPLGIAPAVELRAELGDFFVVFLAGDDGDFGKGNLLPVALDFLFGIVIIVIGSAAFGHV